MGGIPPPHRVDYLIRAKSVRIFLPDGGSRCVEEGLCGRSESQVEDADIVRKKPIHHKLKLRKVVLFGGKVDVNGLSLCMHTLYIQQVNS